MDNQPRDSMWTRALLACGAVGPPLFVLVFLVEGATRADYNPLRYTVSSLSIGASGWVQVLNFIVTGLLIVAFAAGLRRVLRNGIGSLWVPLLVGLAGFGLIGAGFFTTDPLFGYPASGPLVLAQYTTHGHLHDLFSALVFIGLPIACFVATRRFGSLGQRGWAWYSALSGLGMLAFFVLAAVGFNQTPGFVQHAGVYQRLSIIIGWAWMTALAVHFLSASPGDAP
jgi:hypothetical protein